MDQNYVPKMLQLLGKSMPINAGPRYVLHAHGIIGEADAIALKFTLHVLHTVHTVQHSTYLHVV